MSMKSEEQVTAEIAALQLVKPKVPKLTALGDDNHAGIDAQIDVLTERMTNDQVHDKYLEGDSHVFFEALHACDWLQGALHAEDDVAPSKNWLTLTA